MEINTEMTRLMDELSNITYGMTVKEAHLAEVCICCGDTPVLYTDAGKREYRQSAICEPCFDQMWEDEE